MKTFNVRWAIDVTANSPEEAAEIALQIQRDPCSIATVFEVRPVAQRGAQPGWVKVDLGFDERLRS